MRGEGGRGLDGNAGFGKGVDQRPQQRVIFAIAAAGNEVSIKGLRRRPIRPMKLPRCGNIHQQRDGHILDGENVFQQVERFLRKNVQLRVSGDRTDVVKITGARRRVFT